MVKKEPQHAIIMRNYPPKHNAAQKEAKRIMYYIEQH